MLSVRLTPRPSGPRAGARVRRAGLLSLLLLVGAGAGCVQYHEDVWVYEDHSGRVEGQVRVPTGDWDAALASGLLRRGELQSLCQRVASDVPGVELAAFDEVATSEHYRANWAFTFTGPTALGNLLQAGTDRALGLLPHTDGPGPRVAQEVTVERLGRLTSIRRPIPGTPGVLSDRMLRQALQDDRAEFRVHTPEPIVGPRDLRVDADGRTATWDLALIDMLGEGADLRVSYRRPFPAATVAGCLGALLLSIGGIWGLAYRHMMRATVSPEPVEVAESREAAASRDSFDESESGEFTDEE